MTLLPLLIIVPLVGALVALSLRTARGTWVDAVSFITVLVNGVLAILVQRGAHACGALVFAPSSVCSTTGTILFADGLSGFLLVAVSAVMICMVMYALDALEEGWDRAQSFFLMLVLLSGLNGVLLAGDLFTLYVFMEVSVIPAYILATTSRAPAGYESAFKYAVMGAISSLFIVGAMALLYAVTGTTAFHQIAVQWPVRDHFLYVLVLLLFIAGTAVKATLVPFSSWVPDAYSAAPAPVAGMYAGAVCKVVGIYTMMRLLYNVLGYDQRVMGLLGALGAASILIGVTLALYQWHFKRLLAYHSISQVGYMIVGLSLGTPLGLAGGLLHLINHSAFKPLLFLAAGNIESSSGATSLKDMGGLSRRMPVTGVTSMIASLSISGVPPFNGFWSKLMIILACIQAGKSGYALIAVVGSILTLASFMKVQRYAFMGYPSESSGNVTEATLSRRLAMILLAALCVGMGILLLPGLNESYLYPAVHALAGGARTLAYVAKGLP